MHTGAARKGFVTSVTHSPPVSMYTGCTLVYEYTENNASCLWIHFFIYLLCDDNKNCGNVMMFTIINDDNVHRQIQRCETK